MPRLTRLEALVRRFGLLGLSRRLKISIRTLERWRKRGIPKTRNYEVIFLYNKLKEKTKTKKKKKVSTKKKPKKLLPKKYKRQKKKKKYIVTSQNLLVFRLNKYYEAYLRKHKEVSFQAPGYRKYNQAYIVQRGGAEGLLLSRYISKRVTRKTGVEIYRRIKKDAISFQSALPGGYLYITFSLFEYGVHFVGHSPNPTNFGDEHVKLMSSFISTRGDLSLEAFMKSVDLYLRRMMISEGSAVKIQSYTIRIYRL